MSSSELSEKLAQIEKRLDTIESMLRKIVPEEEPKTPLDSSLDLMDLLELPDSLRKTMMASNELKEATAEEIAAKTKRARSVESIYLNQLVRMGRLERNRRGRKVYFKPVKYI
jgi:DNA-binding transcriptional ArsR family regulator